MLCFLGFGKKNKKTFEMQIDVSNEARPLIEARINLLSI